MNGFLTYVAKRFAQFLFVVVTGVTLAFLIAHLSPVDPIEQTVSLLTNFGATDPRAVEVLRESLRELYGADGSLFEQYLAFWGRVLTGDFGPSLSAFPTPVMTIIRNALPWTVGLLTPRPWSPGSSATCSARSPATSAPTPCSRCSASV